MTSFTTKSFSFTAIILGTLLIFEVATKRISFSAVTISLAMLATFWYCSLKSNPTKSEMVTSQLFLLIHALGLLVGLQRSFGGTGLDTWLHLIAAYLITMFITRYFISQGFPVKQSVLYAISITFLLGIGVEIVQFLDKLLLQNLESHCLAGWCSYWADSSKDLINDALGAVFYALPRMTSTPTS